MCQKQRLVQKLNKFVSFFISFLYSCNYLRASTFPCCVMTNSSHKKRFGDEMNQIGPKVSNSRDLLRNAHLAAAVAHNLRGMKNQSPEANDAADCTICSLWLLIFYISLLREVDASPAILPSAINLARQRRNSHRSENGLNYRKKECGAGKNYLLCCRRGKFTCIFR